jgi:hypothetical protein
MISLIVIIVFALTTMAAGSYYFYTIIYSQNMQLKAQKNDLFLQNIKSNLILSAKQLGDDGEYVLPYGDNTKGDYHTVPSWLSMERKNPWGAYVMYCPLGYKSSGVLNDSVKLNELESYSVELVNDFRTEERGVTRDYVTSSKFVDVTGNGELDNSPDFNNDGAPDDILGFLISPYPNKTQTVPSCKDIVYIQSEEVFSSVGGTVQVLFRNEAESFDKINAASLDLEDKGYNFNVNNVSTNTLNNNLNYYRSFSDKRKVYFYLGDGEYSYDSISFENDDKFEKEIVFIGVVDDPETSEVEKSIITSTSTSSTMIFDGYNVTLKNVNFDDKTRVQINNGNLYTEGDTSLSNPFINNGNWFVKDKTTVLASSLNNVTDVVNGSVSSVFIKNSKLLIDGSNQLIINLDSSDDWGLYGFGSELIMEGNGTTNNLVINHNGISGNYGIVFYQSNIFMRDANIYLNSSTSQVMGIYLDGDSKYNAFNGRLDLSGREQVGIYLRGSMESIGHQVRNRNYFSSNPAPLIDLRDGAKLVLRNSAVVGNSNLASRPHIGIVDNGGGFVGGNALGVDTVQVYARSKCWQGPSQTEPRIFEATYPNSGLVSDIGEDSSTTLVKNTINVNYEIYKLSNNSNWNCNK